MANWSMAINGVTVTSVIRAMSLKRKVNGVSTLSATLALPVVAGSELTLAHRDAIVLTSPESRVEFRGKVTSVTSDGRSVSFEAEDRLSGVRDLSVAKVYSGDDQSEITEDICENLMPAADILTLDDDLDAADLVTLGTFTVAQMNGLEALLRLHQDAPSGRAQHAIYHEPAGDVLRLEVLGAASSGVTMALGAGLRAPPEWDDATGRLQNLITTYTETATATGSDAVSQTAYGLRAASYNRPDFGDADLATLAAAMLQARKDTTMRVAVPCRWKDLVPTAGSPLNKTYVIRDPSRSFVSDAARFSSDASVPVGGEGLWTERKHLHVTSAVKPSSRIAFELKSSDAAIHVQVRLNGISGSTGTELIASVTDATDVWVRYYVDIGYQLNLNDVVRLYTIGGTYGSAYVKNLRVCYDAGQVTIPLVEYEMEYPGSKVYATFDELVTMESETAADLEQRVNILENYQPTGGAATDEFTYVQVAGGIAVNGYLGKGGAVEVPASIDGNPVVAIEEWYLQTPSIELITSVKLPDSVLSIGVAAFGGMTSLHGIMLGNGVQSIGHHAFQNLPNLQAIYIPSSCTSIGAAAFQDCTGLFGLGIGNGVQTIGDQAFENCTKLAAVGLPASLTYLGHYAFGHCSALTTVIFMGGSFLIDTLCFQNCSGLTTIGFEGMDMGTATANANWLYQVPYNYLEAHAHAESNWPTQGQVWPSGQVRGNSGVQMGTNL